MCLPRNKHTFPLSTCQPDQEFCSKYACHISKRTLTQNPTQHTLQKNMWPKQKMLLRQKKKHQKKVIPRLFQNSLNLELL